MRRGRLRLHTAALGPLCDSHIGCLRRLGQVSAAAETLAAKEAEIDAGETARSCILTLGSVSDASYLCHAAVTAAREGTARETALRAELAAASAASAAAVAAADSDKAQVGAAAAACAPPTRARGGTHLSVRRRAQALERCAAAEATVAEMEAVQAELLSSIGAADADLVSAAC